MLNMNNHLEKIDSIEKHLTIYKDKINSINKKSEQIVLDKYLEYVEDTLLELCSDTEVRSESMSEKIKNYNKVMDELKNSIPDLFRIYLSTTTLL